MGSKTRRLKRGGWFSCFGTRCRRRSKPKQPMLDESLHAAFEDKNMEEFKKLLDKGANINSIIKDKTLFNYIKDYDMFFDLTNTSFNWNIKYADGDSPALIAARFAIFYEDADNDILEDMIKYAEIDWSIKSPSGNTPLIEAAQYGNTLGFESILVSGISDELHGVDNIKDYINIKNDEGHPALIYVNDFTEPYKTKMINLLCDTGADDCNVIITDSNESRIIKSGEANAISYVNIANGAKMINFHDEFKLGRFYTEDTFNSLKTPKTNPFTAEKIAKATRYTATVPKNSNSKKSGKTRSKSRSRSKSKG